jgi:hypothetical protein
MPNGKLITLSTVLLVAVLCATMLLPYLPGRFDASAATLSFLVRIVSYASLILTPVGLAWMVTPQRSRLWHRVTLAMGGIIALAAAIAAVAVNQLAIGVIVGVGGVAFVLRAHRRMQADLVRVGEGRNLIPAIVACVPVLLISFQSAVLPRAAEWSRDRAIEHSAALIAEIESSRQRRGHYPVSLQSLNRDVPTGVVGIERLLYEPNGEAYNLFFIRPYIELDATEVVMFNPRDEHRFTSHELDLLQYDGEQLELRRGDRRRTPLRQAHWVSILFD